MPNFVQRWMPLAIVMNLLVACATASSNPACVCPPVKKYDRQFQERLAKEIEALPQGDLATVQALQDYAALRLQISLCR